MMHYTKTLAFCLICAVPALALANPDTGKPERIYDLKKSVSDGLNNSNILLFTKQEINLNKNRVKEARSLLYPHVGINANISKFTANDLYALSPELGSTILQPTGKDSDNFYSSRLTLKKGIYTGGRAFSTLRLAKASLERAKSQYQEITNNIIFNIHKEFHTLLFYQKKETIFKEILKDFMAYRDAVKKKYNKPIDRVRLQNLTAELDSRIAEYSRDTERARLLFIEALNIEHNTRVSINGELKPVEYEQASLSTCLSWADEFRPELKQWQFQEEIDVLSVNLSMAERYPTVHFGASYEFNGNEFPLDSENWNATLSLNFPIFDGWAGWARVRQKRAQREQGRYKKAQLQDEVHMEVRLAFSDYMFWLEQIEPRENQMKANYTLAGAVKNDYRKAHMSPDEYLEILIKITETETRYLQAVKEQNIAYAALEKATGKALKGNHE